MPSIVRQASLLAATAVLLHLHAPAQAGDRAAGTLAYGVWEGEIMVNTIPDVDHDGEEKEFIRLINCPGALLLHYRGKDGQMEAGIPLTAIPLGLIYIMLYAASGTDRTGRWMESQVWTLVDASPNNWTISLSRAVINPDKKPDDPWYTFRRTAWGTLTQTGHGCPSSPTSPSTP